MPSPVEIIHHDIVVVGAGGAGMMALLTAAQHHLSIACVSKVFPTRSHTVAAQGGINAALGNITQDHWRYHMYDTIKGGDWLCDADSVERLCREAASSIRQLEHYGVNFSRTVTGTIDQRMYGGQSTDYGNGGFAYRACYVADRTGQSILNTLYQQSLRYGTNYYTDHFALDLLFDHQQRCIGVSIWDMERGQRKILLAAAVIIATGGYGQVYANATSSSICTGDGNAMILRAGLPLQDMEFVQFHPTGLYGYGILLSEAARAEGAYLLNANNERFMEYYAPRYKELASRDIIARAMAMEIRNGNGAGNNKDHLWLDLRHIADNILQEKLPTIISNTHTFLQLNPKHSLIPITPTVHYTMGGIPTNANTEVLDQERKIVPGLYAIGEAACSSVHGANRLGCNSLLDLIVFGIEAAKQAVNFCKKNPSSTYQMPDFSDAFSLIDNFIPSLKPQAENPSSQQKKDGSRMTPSLIKKNIQQTMSEYVGVFRSQESLESAREKLQTIEKTIQNLTLEDHSLIWNQSLIEAMECCNLLDQAKATVESALYRLESRGAHERDDYPERDDAQWLAHTLYRHSSTIPTSLSRTPLRHELIANDLRFFPQKRNY